MRSLFHAILPVFAIFPIVSCSSSNVDAFGHSTYTIPQSALVGAANKPGMVGYSINRNKPPAYRWDRFEKTPRLEINHPYFDRMYYRSSTNRFY